MLQPVFAYFGPETMLPVASIIGAVGGVVLMFGRNLVRVALRLSRMPFRRYQRSAPELLDIGTQADVPS